MCKHLVDHFYLWLCACTRRCHLATTGILWYSHGLICLSVDLMRSSTVQCSRLMGRDCLSRSPQKAAEDSIHRTGRRSHGLSDQSAEQCLETECSGAEVSLHRAPTTLCYTLNTHYNDHKASNKGPWGVLVCPKQYLPSTLRLRRLGAGALCVMLVWQCRELGRSSEGGMRRF